MEDIPVPDRHLKVAGLADADLLPLAVSDDAVVQLLGAAFARLPLVPGALRDARLIAFLMDVDSGRFGQGSLVDLDVLTPVNQVHDRLVALSGISIARVRVGVVRLNQAGVLEVSSGPNGAGYRFSDQVLRPAGIGQYVEWHAVLGKLAGQVPALVVLRAVLDLLHHPWEWERLTYDAVAAQACYSLGMAQRGMSMLLNAAVLERAVRAGRGHDYRLTQWALGRGQADRDAVLAPDVEGPILQELPAVEVPSQHRSEPLVVRATNLLNELADSSPMVVEIGGLIVRVPVGTEIQMTLGSDGVPVYQLGADMRITRRGTSAS